MKKLLAVLMVLSLFVVLPGCQKETSVENGNNIIPNPNPNPGSNSNSYHPLTSGSFWKYKDSTTGGFTTMTALNLTQTINNRLYTAIKTTNGAQLDTVYAAVVGPDYFYYFNLSSPGGAPIDLLYHYLNDTASVGYEWEYNAGTGNGFTAIVNTSIIEKGITVTINGQTYQNVIHSRMELNYDIMGMILPFGTYDYYVARGVGIVRIRAVADQFGTYITTCSDLVDYHIN
jgi:hypothetical protein